MHAVVALALPTVEAFDLAIPAQVFADPGLLKRYDFTVEDIAARCGLYRGQPAPAPGPRRRHYAHVVPGGVPGHPGG